MTEAKQYDCPLCPGTVTATSHTLVAFGMFVCDDCAAQWVTNWDCTYQTMNPTATAWLQEVHHTKQRYQVGERVARRWVAARHLGLEVDIMDLDLDLERRLPWTT